MAEQPAKPRDLYAEHASRCGEPYEMKKNFRKSSESHVASGGISDVSPGPVATRVLRPCQGLKDVERVDRPAVRDGRQMGDR